MIYKGDVVVKIPQNLYESISLTLNDSPIESLKLSLTNMEAKCNECHKPFNEGDEILTIINSSMLDNNVVELSSDLFTLHKSCLEEFVSSYLNRKIQEEEALE